jgi:hypothetical protein
MGTAPVSSTESEIIKTVRWRYRVYRYLQITGSIWFVLGAVLSVYATGVANNPLRFCSIAVIAVSVGISTAGYAVCLAVYRCPACDRRLNPRKGHCPGCGVKVR